MKRMPARTLVTAIAVSIVGVFPAIAADEPKNEIGVVVGYIAPSSDSTIQGTKFEADSTVDYGAEYRRRFLESNRLSLGASILYAKHDVKANGQKGATIENLPILIDANWHLLKRKNLYFGVTAGISTWGDLKPTDGSGNISIKQDFVYGLNSGYDISIGSRFAILLNLRYLSQKAETDEPSFPDESVDVNPIIANVGFAFRF